MTSGCVRTGCGHTIAQHQAAGGCLVCSCGGFEPWSKGAQITRCSYCWRRPDSQGRNHAAGCVRAGDPPNAREDKRKL